MTNRKASKGELERVAARGWLFTLRYALLLQASTPSTRLGKWATALVSAIGSSLMSIAAARGFR
ncbi:hypothetical protein [Mycobacterium sp. Marseille-P9652]|uniref:hypothetical protein n=1 Tax=Mycobacterium sp. Marseille-P9652 TaxID=2654950 RepID=UPI0012E8FFB0|nr:hypothetical protein [Mycobacterium sp. Marseille-P9652]